MTEPQARLGVWLAVPTALLAVTVVAAELPPSMTGMDLSWLYLLTVLPVTLRWGRLAGSAAATLALTLLLGVVVEPRQSLAVADPWDYLRVGLTGGGMLLVIGVTRRRSV